VISVDWTLGLQFLNFAVLLFILNKILYKPLQKIIAQRRETIQSSQLRAKNLQVEIDNKMQRYQQQLQDAKSAANDERNKLKKSGIEQESALLAEAHHKAADRLLQIKEKVNREAGDASRKLKDEVDSLAGQIASKILGRDVA